MKPSLCLLVLLLSVSAPTICATEAAPARAAASSTQGDPQVARLNALIEEHWQGFLDAWPEQASFFGDLRGNDRWGDYSPEAAARQAERTRDLHARLSAIDASGLSDTDRSNRQILLHLLEDDIAAHEHKIGLMPLDQFNGVHLLLPIYAKSFPFRTAQHYRDYIARLQALPMVLQQVAATARAGMREGLMPPRYLLEKLVAQCDAIADAAGADNTFAAPVRTFPDSVPESERAALREAAITAVDGEVRPAYAALSTFIAREYAPQGRQEAGIWSLPNGDAIYRDRIRQLASTDRDPEAIHQLGLSEVARIEGEMTAIARKLGHRDLAAMRRAIKQDRNLYAGSREQILALYERYAGRMQSRLPELFGTLPKAKLQVVEVERHREKSASAASYMAGTADGARPGMLFVNTGDHDKRLLLSIESIAYHEGLPGHHLQTSIARTLPDLPKFRTLFNQMAYVEGWGLYAERLGKEVGFYQDPYNDYGRLAQELMRANRLVLDTGVHYKRWTREQMVEWLHAHYEPDDAYIQAEVDRYIAWPGQALAYKIGELKLVELRERALKALGKRFDIRHFHDTALGGGSMPLSVLEQRVDAWIAATAAGGANADNPR